MQVRSHGSPLPALDLTRWCGCDCTQVPSVTCTAGPRSPREQQPPPVMTSAGYISCGADTLTDSSLRAASPSLCSATMSSLSKKQSLEPDKDSKVSHDHVQLDTSDAPEEAPHYQGATVSLQHNVNAILQNPLAGIPQVRAISALRLNYPPEPCAAPTTGPTDGRRQGVLQHGRPHGAPRRL